MSTNSTTSFMTLLALPRMGNSSAEAQAFDRVSSTLHAIARQLFINERPNHTLQPTALVSDDWIKLIRACGQNAARIVRRRRFCVVAARLMRNILIDYSRYKSALRLQSTAFLTAGHPFEKPATDDTLHLHEALEHFAKVDTNRQQRLAVSKSTALMRIGIAIPQHDRTRW